MPKATQLADDRRLGEKDKVLAEVNGHAAMLRLPAFASTLDERRKLDTEGGAGITAGTGTVLATAVQRVGGIIYTQVLIDLTGLNSGGTAGDVIGVDGSGAAYLCQMNASEVGTLMGGRVTCLETPAGGDTDIDLYSAVEATGVEDTAISALDETQLVNAGAHSIGTSDFLTALPADGEYLYLVGQGTSNATYTAGRLLIEFWGAA